MANTFAILLTLATFITGIFWFLEKFKWKPARQKKVEAVRKQTEGKIDGKILAQVGQPPKWVENTASFFPVLFLVFAVRSFVVEPYQIPSGSMMPTLLIGDFIAVQKFSYGIKDPITNTTIIPTGKPQRGEVAVFKHPKQPSMDLIKRVVGLPGDKVIYNADAKTLTIYPACTTEDINCQGQQDKPLNLDYTAIKDSDWFEVFSQKEQRFYTKQEYNQLGLANDPQLFSLEMLTRNETLSTDTHSLLLLPRVIYKSQDFYRQVGQKPGEWVVPEGQYFMMGDNRDNSDDSRFWGFVPEENFVGRAFFIWLSLDKQPDEWPTGIRFGQIGSIN